MNLLFRLFIFGLLPLLIAKPINPDGKETSVLLENIKKRGRKYEQSIEADYLMKINEGYLDFIKTQHAGNVKLIDVSERDFVKSRKDYLSVLKEVID